MEFPNTLPGFDEGWISQSDAIVAAHGGIPPHLSYRRADYEVDAGRILVDDEIEKAIADHVQRRGSDLPSRFAALNYLWTADCAGFARSCEEDDDDSPVPVSGRVAHMALRRLVDRLDPESISTPEQAAWEFKQALILGNGDRLRRLGERRRALGGMSSDDLNLLMGRAFWFPNSQHWASFYAQVAGVPVRVGDASWEAVLDGDRLAVSQAAALPPETHEPQDRDLIVDAIASLRKVSPGSMGPHWGILADCEAMTDSPDQCASIWEQYGAEILQPFAETEKCSGASLLSLPDYQLRIADLWEEADRPEKAIETLESLRRTRPRLQGVNRRLVELYIGRNDLDLAVRRLRDEADCDEVFHADSIVRLALWAQQDSEEARAKLLEQRDRYQSYSSNVGQRTAIRNVLCLVWRPFDQLSPSVQEDWVRGLWWCHGEHSGELSESERARDAVTNCARALETHLREKVFERLRETAKPTDVGCLPKGLQNLQDYLKRNKAQVELGVMLDAVQSSSPTSSGVAKALWDLLCKRSSNPHSLRDPRFDRIRKLRNSASHDSRLGPSIEEAKECLRLCEEFLSILEQPPQPRPVPGRKG